MRAIMLAALTAVSLLAQYGPKDGRDLPPTDIGRVKIGEPAPDFTLPTGWGSVFSLSDFRGKNVVLVFYRGHW